MASMEQLIDAAKGELSTKLLGGAPVLRGSSVNVLAALIGNLQYSNEVFLQSLIDNAAAIALESLGPTIGVPRLYATQASGYIQIQAESGSTMPAGTYFTRCDGTRYKTTQQITATSTGPINIPVTSVEAGQHTNIENGSEFTLNASLIGFAQSGLSLDIIGGTDDECDEDYIARVKLKLTAPCKTGTIADYEFWAREHPGVTRVCVKPLEQGPGTVTIYPMMDNTYANGIPAPADIQAIYDSVFDGTNITGVVGSVCAPTPEEIDVHITGVGTLSAADFTSLRSAVESAFLGFWDCGFPTVCRTDIEIAAKELFGGCPEVTNPPNNVSFLYNHVPVLGVLTVS